MPNNDHFVQCRNQHLLFLENTINSILSDTAKNCSVAPSSQIKRLHTAMEFLFGCTEELSKSIAHLETQLFTLRFKKRYSPAKKFRDLKLRRMLQREIKFKQCIIQNYHAFFFCKLNEYISREEKKINFTTRVQ